MAQIQVRSNGKRTVNNKFRHPSAIHPPFSSQNEDETVPSLVKATSKATLIPRGSPALTGQLPEVESFILGDHSDSDYVLQSTYGTGRMGRFSSQGLAARPRYVPNCDEYGFPLPSVLPKLRDISWKVDTNTRSSPESSQEKTTALFRQPPVSSTLWQVYYLSWKTKD